MELPSTSRLRDTVENYNASLRSSSNTQLVLAALINGIVATVFSGFLLTLVVLFAVEKVAGKLGELDGAIVAGFLFIAMAGTGFVAGFTGTLGVSRRRFGTPIVATLLTLAVASISWFATAQLAQILWWATPIIVAAIAAIFLLRLQPQG